jgi:hypothetical protein
VNIKQSTDKIPEKILPNLDKVYDELRSLFGVLNAKIEKLQKSVSSPDAEDASELKSMSNLRECVRAAADVVSTTSSTLTVETSDKKSVRHGSDFGDLYVRDTNEPMMRWMSSNTVYEYDEMSPLPDPSEASTGDTQPEYVSDSDSDLENDMIRALFTSATKLMGEGDLIGAERKLRNCLSRLSTNASTYSLKTAAANDVSRAELLERLIEVYCLRKSWPKAKAAMMEKLSVTERQVGKKDELYLTDLLKLAEIMVETEQYVEAHLQGRRSLRGFKKLGEPGFEGYEKSLVFLVHLCNIDSKADEEEAYAALLGSHRASKNRMFPFQPDRGTTPALRIATAENSVNIPHSDPAVPLISEDPKQEDITPVEETKEDQESSIASASCEALALSDIGVKNLVDARQQTRSASSAHGILQSEPHTPTEQHSPSSIMTETFTTAVEKVPALSEVPDEPQTSTEASPSTSHSSRLREEEPLLPDATTNTQHSSTPIWASNAKYNNAHEVQVTERPSGSTILHEDRDQTKTVARSPPSPGLLAQVPKLTIPPNMFVFTGKKPAVPFQIEGLIGWMPAAYHAQNIWSECYKTDSSDRSMNSYKSESPFDIITTFCRRRHGKVPYLTTWSNSDGWSCRVVLDNSKSWVISGKATHLRAKQAATTLAFERLMDQSTKDLILRGQKLRDPYSDKVVVELDEQWSGVSTSERPSLTASTFVSVPQITISSGHDEQDVVDSSVGIRRSASDSRLPRNHTIAPGRGGSTHRRATTRTDLLAFSDGLDSGFTSGAALSCPMCNVSLLFLSETSKSAHVNSCIDGSPISVEELRAAEPDPPTSTTPTTSTTTTSSQPLNASQDIWACSGCKSKSLQFFDDDKCNSCGTKRGFYSLGSWNNFERKPFDQYRTLLTSLDVGALNSAHGSSLRRKILLLGDTLCGKTWLAR